MQTSASPGAASQIASSPPTTNAESKKTCESHTRSQGEARSAAAKRSVKLSHGVGDFLDDEPARLPQPPRLAPEAVEFARAREHAQRPRELEAGVDSRDELVRVRRERDLPRIRQR